MHDTTISAMSMNVEIVDDHISLAVITGITLPLGPQPLPIPTGIYRIPIGKEAAEQIGQALIDGASQLPETKKPSDLVVAQSLAGVDQVVQAQEHFKKGA